MIDKCAWDWDEEFDKLREKAKEIKRYATHLEVRVEEDANEVRLMIDGKRVFGRPDPYTLWFYMAGYRDGARGATKFSKQWLQSRVSRAIISAINDHGSIDKCNVSSAAKRVVGQLQSLAFALFTQGGIQWDEQDEETAPPLVEDAARGFDNQGMEE